MPASAPEPDGSPLGLLLATTAREVGRAFDTALGEAGGSVSTWLVLLALVTRPGASQRELAESIGIQGATLTHHLNGMEADGLLTRRRDPANRRVHLVELTDAGRAAFARLRDVAVAHDRRLHTDLDPDDVAATRRVLARLGRNVGRVGARAVAGPAGAAGRSGC